MGLAWHPDRETLVVAVADGVSSAPLSHLGATLVCRYALNFFAKQPSPPSGEDWRAVIQGCAWSLVDALQRMDSLDLPEPPTAEYLLATTLCIALVRPDGDGLSVSGASVGDTGIAVLCGTDLRPLVGGKSPGDDGVSRHDVTPLPWVPDEIDSGEWSVGPSETLLVATDGLWDPLGDGSGPVGAHLRGALCGERLPGLHDFLSAIDFYRETFDDDRTVVAVKSRPGGAVPNEVRS
jgi:hypothetical protein